MNELTLRRKGAEKSFCPSQPWFFILPGARRPAILGLCCNAFAGKMPEFYIRPGMVLLKMCKQQGKRIMILRHQTREIRIGNVSVGGNSPIAVQSMTNTDTRDVEATVAQIHALEKAGCEIIRVAVLDIEAAAALSRIREAIAIPLIADIHFDHRLAVAAMENGAQAIRINPGNLGGPAKLARVVDAAKIHQVPIRVGVNSGSIEKDLLKKHGYPTPEIPPPWSRAPCAMSVCWKSWVSDEIKISIKSSDVLTTISGLSSLARETDYPLHLGVTEAGGLIAGTVKSSVALGILLYRGNRRHLPHLPDPRSGGGDPGRL